MLPSVRALVLDMFCVGALDVAAGLGVPAYLRSTTPPAPAASPSTCTSRPAAHAGQGGRQLRGHRGRTAPLPGGAHLGLHGHDWNLNLDLNNIPDDVMQVEVEVHEVEEFVDPIQPDQQLGQQNRPDEEPRHSFTVSED